MMKHLVCSLLVGAMSVIAWFELSEAQSGRDFTGRIPTVEELRDALKPRSAPPPIKEVPMAKPGSRAVIMVPVKPECSSYRKQAARGIKLVPDSEVVSLKVTFAVNSATLTDEGEQILSRLGEALKEDQLHSCCFQIEGHTDNTGPDAYNERLSEKRALSVAQYLKKKHGVSSDRLLAIGHGEKDPVGDNETEEGKQQNRRVQVFNLGYAKPEKP